MLSLQKSIAHPKEFNRSIALQRILLFCGLVSTIWYIAISIIVPLQYPGYSVITYTVSELSAIDAPTKTLWMILGVFYTLLMLAFGLGVWQSSGNWKMRLVGLLFIVDAVFGAFWPPMHRREVIAAGGGTLTDTLHVVWAYVHLVFMLVVMGFTAASLGKGFRIYTIVTVIVFLVFGMLTSYEAPGISTNQPTPHIGIWERINMGAYMIWISVLATILLRKKKVHSTIQTEISHEAIP